MGEADAEFDIIMEKIGNNGRFHIIFGAIYVFGVTIAGAWAYTNLVLALNEPDHWCHVPGYESTNFTLDEWRHITLPRKLDNTGQEKYDNCQMYNYNFTALNHTEYFNINKTDWEVTSCVHGYVYDREYYDATIVTEEHWVCEDDLKVFNVFVASRIAEVLGTLVFGQLGDTLGRQPIYYISLALIVLGRIVAIVTTSAYAWFIISVVVGSVAINTVFQSPLIVAMEISSESARANIAMVQAMGWSVGTCLMPFVYWWMKDWKPFLWVTTLLLAVFLVFYKYMIESPRWLISKRRYSEALSYLKKIARINGRKFDMTEAELSARYASEEEEKIFGIASLFSSWRMTRLTLTMAFSWCVVACSYFTLLLFISRMKGNPYLNFFIQSLVEIPAYVVGKYLSDKIGRRYTNCLSFLLASVTCMFIIAFSKDPKYENAMIYAATFVKFLNGVTYFAVSLQAMEMYPTCLRQTGISLGVISGNAVGILSPYFVYLGTTYDIRYPYYILLVLLFAAMGTGLFLPETLHQKLPDSLHDAHNFGRDQVFWSIPKPPKIIKEVDFEKEKLNSKLQNGV